MIIIAGRTDTFGPLGSLALKMPIVLYSNPHEVRPPTGEPDAGDPHVRFGGRGGANQCAIPTPIVISDSYENTGHRFSPVRRLFTRPSFLLKQESFLFVVTWQWLPAERERR